MAAALMVNGAVPVEVRVSVSLAAVFTAVFPKLTLEGLTLSVDVPAPSRSDRVSVTPPALAVSVTVVLEVTAETVAVKPALVDPDATVTVAGTLTAELLLERFTAKPPLAAAAFSVTEQLSVPAPVMEPSAQLSPASTGTPVPLRAMAVEVPVDELLVNVSDPETAPTAAGSNCTLRVAV